MALIQQISTDGDSPVDTDINIVEGDVFRFDQVFTEELDIGTTSALYPAVIISLFCDARAPADVNIPGTALNKRRGWWGDKYNRIDGDQIGSLLWLYQREKITNDTLNGMRQVCLAALEWMKTDKIADKVEVTVVRSRTNDYAVVISVKIFKPTGDLTEFSFLYAWEAQGDT